MNKELLKLTSIILSLLMLFTIFSVAVFAADVRPVSTETVTCIDENGEPQTVVAGIIDGGGQPYGAAGEPGWYVVKGELSLSSAVLFNDSETNIILADDCDCSYLPNSFCFIPTGTNAVPMNIYSQANGTGRLTVKARLGALYGDLNIYGGNITAEGIHADMRNNTESGTITINNGTVTVKNFYTKDLIINGGTVNAESTSAIKGNLTINDGTVTVNEPSPNSLALSSPDGKLTINGGNVTSTGVYGLQAAELEINGGTVNATGTGTFGIFTRESLVINGGSVTAQGAKFGICNNGESVAIGMKTPGASLTVNTDVHPGNSYIIADGQTLTDGEKTYSGTLTADGFNEAVGKTLTCKHVMADEWTYFDESLHVKICTICGEVETEAHDIIVKGAGDATCGNEGYTGDEYCSVCGERLSVGEIIPATGNHTTALVNAKEATATEEGYTGDEVCTVCGQTIKQGEVIPETGDTTPDEPDDGDACPYCGKVHAKKWVRIVHLVLWFLCKTFHIVRK